MWNKRLSLGGGGSRKGTKPFSDEFISEGNIRLESKEQSTMANPDIKTVGLFLFAEGPCAVVSRT